MWGKYAFEILLIACITFILIFGLYRKIRGKKGSWSDKYYYDGNKVKFPKEFPKEFPNKSRRPPTESKGEIECKRVLESIFSKPFPKIRPDFLKNHIVNGSNLEIDCYNPELKLGCEYNGIQHYEFKPFFHKNKEAFYNQKYRDDMKRRMCKDNGVFLIEVPYSVKNQDIEGFIRDKLRYFNY